MAVFRALDVPLSPGAGLLVLALVEGGTIPPSSPSQLGVFHALVVFGLQSLTAGPLAGIERTPALVYATILHVAIYGPPVLLGAVALGLPATEKYDDP